MRIRFYTSLPNGVTKFDYRSELEKKAYLEKYVTSYTSAESWCVRKNPILVVYDTKNQKELVYGYNEGYIGDQLLLL